MEPDPVLTDPRYLALIKENEELRGGNEELRRGKEELQRENEELRAELRAVNESLAKVEKLLASMQEKASKDSHNSNKPPGSDGPKAKPRPSSPPTGRSRGGQNGHTGKAREPLPEGSETRTVPVIPIRLQT
jgi:DNA-binding protein H-NS